MDPLSSSPTSTIGVVFLNFKLRDRVSGITYQCYIRIGEKNSSRSFSIDMVKNEILKWVSQIRFTGGGIPKMIIQIDVPIGQQYCIPYFSTKFLVVDLVSVLGVSYQEIYNANFEVIQTDCSIISFPRDATEYP
uniref:Matrix protein n=1 Tax=Macrotermes subhyalinus lispivirus 1 TaxID=3133482 RepID=A0AAT9J9Y1_9MONO